MFKNYKREGNIAGIREQHNIMIFIGNGFDISVLRKYRDDNLVSSYSKFYDFLCYKGFNYENILYKKMGLDRRRGKENWSDFECSLGGAAAKWCICESSGECTQRNEGHVFAVFK